MSELLVPLGRYARLARSLRPHQLPARMRLRTQRALFTRYPAVCGALLRGEAVAGCWPAAFVPFDGRVAPPEPSPAALAAGRITLLGHPRRLFAPDRGGQAAGRRQVGRKQDDCGQGGRQRPAWDQVDWEQVDWEQRDAPLLWRYHLHYWDWAWALTRHDPREAGAVFAGLYLSWRRACPAGRGVAWSPYVASLRAWALCGLWHPLARTGPAARAVRADLGVHRSYLRAHLETDVGGNHLLKNLKALVGLAVAADDPRDCRRWLDALARELDRQVLADGGHYERAPAYHCQVLADVDDLARLLAHSGFGRPDDLAALAATAAAMRRWLSAVLAPDGAVPLLNDGYPVGAEVVRELLAPAEEPGAGNAVPEPDIPDSGISAVSPAVAPGPAGGAVPPAAAAARCELLADSGLAVLAAGPWRVLADVGPPCPDELPAHAHADTLAFLAWHDGVPVLVDTGTSTYEPGPLRDAERGTAAHSTVTVDGVDSTEVWGAFRAGRRARAHLVRVTATADTVAVAAWHDGYRHLVGQPTHHRTWQVDRRAVRVLDRVEGAGTHRVEVAFQLAPGVTVTAAAPGAGAGELAVTPASGRRLALRAAGPGRWELRRGRRATGWGTTAPATTAVYVVDGPLPIEVRTELADHPAPAHPAPTAG